MDQCELNSNNDNSQGGKHNVKQKKKITKTSTGSVVFLREGSIHKETAKCHDESSPTFPFFFLFFSISELLEKSFKNTHRKHSQRADKTPADIHVSKCNTGTFNGQRGRHEAVKAAQQQPVNRTAHREGGDASVESFFFFF